MPAKNIKPSVEPVQWCVNNITAFTTTRIIFNENGVTETPTLNGIFNHFNLGLHVGDNPEHVQANRQALSSLLPINTDIQWLDQVHGDAVLTIDRVSTQAPKADAMYSNKQNIALAIMTADCLPILISHINGSEIAAIHGGWRSLAQNIIAKTVNKFSCQPEDLVVWLGPCIGSNMFEVGQDVFNFFINQNVTAYNHLADAFTAKNEEKYFADLHKIAKEQCQALGITCITQLNECTYQTPQKYYSYRRDTHTGRMASIICQKPKS